MKSLTNILSLFILLILLPLLLFVGCGKKSSPRPPEAYAPSSVKFLTADGELDAVVLHWQAPDTDASDHTLLDLAGFTVRRSEYVKDESPDFEDLTDVPVAEKKDAQATAASPEQTTPTAKGEKKQPLQYSYSDTTVRPGKQYEYVVIPFNEDGVEGDPVSRLRVTFLGESSYFETLPMEAGR
jgi:hypothetical protein